MLMLKAIYNTYQCRHKLTIVKNNKRDLHTHSHNQKSEHNGLHCSKGEKFSSFINCSSVLYLGFFFIC